MASKQQFYNTVYTAAKSLGANDVQAHLAASQSALETGYGRSVKGNNYFGIKAGSKYSGNTVTFGTHEIIGGKRVNMKDRFRAYTGLRDSVRGYMEFMARKFSDAWNAPTFSEAVKGLRAGKSGGYATDPNYNSKINYISNRFGENVKPVSDVAEFMKNNPQPEGFGLAGFREGIEESAAPIPTPRLEGLGLYAEMTPPMTRAASDAAMAAPQAAPVGVVTRGPDLPAPLVAAPVGAVERGPQLASLSPLPAVPVGPVERAGGLPPVSMPSAPGISDITFNERVASLPPAAPAVSAPVSPPEPAGLGAVPIPTPRPSVSLPDQAPIPTARPSDGAMGAIPIPTPRTDTAAPAMASARTISDMPVAQDAGHFPGAGRDYFPPAPAPYFPPAPGANSGAFDSSPFWQTNTGGLGKFGGILKGAATGAAVGGLPGALVGGLLGSGALQKIFNNTPGGGNPSAPTAAAHGGYVGSGVNAMASVFSGKAAPGSLAASRSNPGTFAMSLPGGLVARSYESPTHGYITGIYGLGPNDDTNPGAKFGKVAALSPDAKSWSFVSPEEARGLQAKGWSVSIGPASKTSVAAPADPSRAKAAVSPAPATTRAAVARSQAKEATPGKLGKAVADIGKAVAQAFGLGNMGLGIGGLGAAPSMASPSLAAPSMYGLVGQSGIGMGGIAGTGLGGYMGAGMGGGWSEANGPAGNRA